MSDAKAKSPNWAVRLAVAAGILLVAGFGVSYALRREKPEESVEEDSGPHGDDREAGPGQSLFRQPVQLVLWAVGALCDAHLRNGHLRHVHEGFYAVVARHGGGVDRGRQVIGRNRHAEIDTRATFDRAVHRGEVGQVALHDLGAELAQGLCALILPTHQGAHLVPFGEQHFGEVAADGADSASRAGYQDRPGMWPLRCHAASLGRLSGGAMIAGDGTGARWAVNPRITGLLTT